MATFLVWELHAGPAWGRARPMSEQSLWNEHATFMDDLVEAGVVLLGGPLDEDRVLLVVEAPSADAVRDRLAQDPWMGSHLVIERIEPWSIRLDGRPR